MMRVDGRWCILRCLLLRVVSTFDYLMTNSTATASAAANIALVKYWGKASISNNQPATGSVSLALEDLRTTTTLEFATGNQDTFDTELDDKARKRVLSFLDRVRLTHQITQRLHITTANNFPTGTGLASSASGFAALCLAFNALFNLNLTGKDLSRMTRLGSGSAARSVYGGIVELIPSDDAYAIPVATAEEWPLDIIVAVTEERPKAIGSTDAMIQTANTSPFYQSWLSSHAEDMTLAKQAITEKDFGKLADTSEQNCLKMHATMTTSVPPIIYWNPDTVEIMHEVRALRSSGTPAFFTIDAGAQVKIVCLPSATDSIRQQLKSIAGLKQVIVTRLGGLPSVTTS